MKRVLLFSSEFPPGPGGIGTHAWQFASHMTDFGWQVQVLTLQDYCTDEEIKGFNNSQSFLIRRLERKSHWVGDLFYRIGRLREVIRNWNPDVMVVTGDRLVWLVAGAYRIWIIPSRLPWMAIWHGDVPNRIMPRRISAWSFGRCNLTVTVSNYSLGKLRQLGCRPKKADVITNGADGQFYTPDSDLGEHFRSEHGLPVDSRVLLTVGHLSERKGQDIVIRAMPDLLKAHPQVHYLVVGLPTIQPELERLAEELRVRSHVHFLGRLSQADLKSAYNSCDIFVLTSRHSSDGQFEGYGIVVAEAALCGKPAVVASNSGLVEAVQDGHTGLIVEENNPAATGQAIGFLLEHPDIRQQMGQNARQRALIEQTSIAKMKEYEIEINYLIRLTKKQ